MQTRAEARDRIHPVLLNPEDLPPYHGNCDEYELKGQGYRLFLIYGRFDGEERVQEVRLVRPEDLLQQQAALTP